jgi:hypothetical protein
MHLTQTGQESFWLESRGLIWQLFHYGIHLSLCKFGKNPVTRLQRVWRPNDPLLVIQGY